MSEMVWLNGHIVPLSAAQVPVDDRGFNFGDGAYEVVRLYGGRPFAMDAHMQRLQNSCAGLRIELPLPMDQLLAEAQQLLVQSDISEGTLYIQVTRGVVRRNHLCPPQIRPTLLMLVRPQPPMPPPGAGPGAKLWTVQDVRWRKCWIKSIALVANVLAKMEAAEHGADEAVLVEEGIVAECASSNLFAVVDGRLITHPVGPRVLPGISRQVVIDCAAELSIEVIERPLALHEAKAADELFITGTTREIHWASTWDGRAIGSGACGRLTLELHQAFVRRRQRELLSSD